MIEKALAAAVEPVIAEVFRLEKRLDEIQLIEGPKGEPGADAPEVDLDAVVAKVFETHGETLKGEPGKDVSVDEVVSNIMENHIETLKGADGVSPSADEVYEKLLGDDTLNMIINKAADELQDVRDRLAIEEIKSVFG